MNAFFPLDDFDNLQAAIDAAFKAGGGTVLASAKCYKIGRTKLKSGVNIVGVNREQTVFECADPDYSETWIENANISKDGSRIDANITVQNITFDGSFRKFPRWLQHKDTGAPITDPEKDYYKNGGKIGHPKFPDYDIAALIDETGRRNPEYRNCEPALAFIKCRNIRIIDCDFRNYNGTVIKDAGCLDTLIAGCNFSHCGKKDGPFPAIWTQSFVTPGKGGKAYAPTENIVVERCRFENLERCAAIFSPARGGVFQNNYTDNTGESCVYINENTNYDGTTQVVIRGNRFGKTYITDIASAHVEAGRVKNLHISDNIFYNSQRSSLFLLGADCCVVVNNKFIDCGYDYVIPYGPFSERFTFAKGSKPVAGKPIYVADFSVIKTGSIKGDGFEYQMISENIARDSRDVKACGFVDLMRVGKGKTVGDLALENNYVEMPLIGKHHDDVFEMADGFMAEDNIVSV